MPFRGLKKTKGKVEKEEKKEVRQREITDTKDGGGRGNGEVSGQ